MQAAAEYCVENAVTMLSISSSFRDRPFELATTGSVSESALPPHGTERQRILNSFRPQDRGCSGTPMQWYCKGMRSSYEPL